MKTKNLKTVGGRPIKRITDDYDPFYDYVTPKKLTKFSSRLCYLQFKEFAELWLAQNGPFDDKELTKLFNEIKDEYYRIVRRFKKY